MNEKIIPRKKFMGMRFFTVEDLMKILGLTGVSVRLYLRTNIIPGVKIGTRWYVRERDLNDFLQGGVRANYISRDDEMKKFIDDRIDKKIEKIYPLIEEKMIELFERYKKVIDNLNKAEKKTKEIEKEQPAIADHFRYRGKEIKKVLEKI